MNRLKELRKSRNLYQKDVAEYLNVNRTTYVKYETGDSEPNFETLQKLADYFEVSIDYLLGRESSPGTNSNAIRVPVYGVIPAGVPIEAIEDIIDYEELDKSSWGNKDYFALKIKGNSMQPNYLDGDIVIFEKSESCESGDDCAVIINGNDATFKRVDIQESGVMLKPLNAEYETKFYDNQQVENLPIRIIGIAKELRRKTRK